MCSARRSQSARPADSPFGLSLATDYPNGPDDPDIPFEQINDAPGREVEVEAEEAEGAS